MVPPLSQVFRVSWNGALAGGPLVTTLHPWPSDRFLTVPALGLTSDPSKLPSARRTIRPAWLDRHARAL
jgi:hypothetical protein